MSFGSRFSRAWGDSFGYVGHLGKKSYDVLSQTENQGTKSLYHMLGHTDWGQLGSGIMSGGPAFKAGTEAGKIAGSKGSRDALGKTWHGLGWAEKNLNLPGITKVLSSPFTLAAGGAFLLAPSFWFKFKFVRYGIFALILALVAPIYFPNLRQSSPFYRHSAFSCSQPVGGLSGVVQAAGSTWGTATTLGTIPREKIQAWLDARATDAGVLWRQFLASLHSHTVQQAPVLTPAQQVALTACCGTQGPSSLPAGSPGVPAGPPTTGSLPTAFTVAPGAALTDAQLAAVARSQFSGPDLPVAEAVALAESGGRPDARNSIGASGLWQILPSAHPEFAAQWADGSWRDPMVNARMARSVFDAAHGWGPWTTFTSGSYLSFMARANAALGGNLSGGTSGTPIANCLPGSAPAGNVLPGPWTNPMPGAVITQAFGGSGGHPGVDLAMPAGTPMLAVHAGTVVAAGFASGFGDNYVAIDVGGGFVVGYGHGSAHMVNVGDQVVAGQPVALEGSEGISTGPHLHLEVRTGGPAPFGPVIDPVAFLAARGVVLGGGSQA